MTEYKQNPAPCKGCKWSREYISWLEPDREGGRNKSRARVGMCISLGFLFSSAILSGHISIHYICFSGHILQACLNLFLEPSLLRASPFKGGQRRENKSSSLFVPFSLPTPMAKHTTQQCGAKIPAQVQHSASCKTLTPSLLAWKAPGPEKISFI